MRIGDWLSIPSTILNAKEWEYGEIVAQYGPFRVHRSAIVLRDGRKRLPGFAVILGDLATPLHLPVWRVNRGTAINGRGCIEVGSINEWSERATVVDVYRHVQRWLRSGETMNALFREPNRGEEFRKAANRREIHQRIVREGVQELCAAYPSELAGFGEDPMTRRIEKRRQQRLRRVLRAVFWVLPKLQHPLRWVAQCRPIRWLFRKHIAVITAPPTDASDTWSTGSEQDDLAMLDRAVRLLPDDATVYHARGVAHWHLGQYEQAIADYTEALQLAPNTADVYFERARCSLHLGRTEEVIADCTEVIRLRPKDGDAFRIRGYCCCNLTNYERAVPDFDEAVRLNPDDAVAHKLRGLAYYRLADRVQAIRDFTTAIRLNPDDADVLLNRGVTYRDSGDTTRAISDLSAAILLNPDFTNAYHNRAFIYYQCGDYERAVEDFDAAIRLNPDDLTLRRSRDAAQSMHR